MFRVAPVVPADAAPLVAAFGWDLESITKDTDAKDRQRTLAWMGDLRTRGGKLRADRIRQCGWLHPARSSDEHGPWEYGVHHKWCRDRFCIRCQRARSSDLTARARAFMGDRTVRGEGSGIYLFATFTQTKQPHEAEDCRAACNRILAAWGRYRGKCRPVARVVGMYVAGGIRGLDVAWSPRGRDHRHGGTAVEFSGWHAHLHCLFELKPPPPEVVEKYGGNVDVALAVWTKEARSALVEMWGRVSEGSRVHAQCVRVAGEHDVFQVCKYVAKPLELKASAAVCRELAVAMGNRQVVVGWGTWLKWRKVKLDLDRREIQWAIGGLMHLQSLVERDDPSARVEYEGWAEGRPVVYSVPLGEVLAGMLADRRTLHQRWEAKASPPTPSPEPALFTPGERAPGVVPGGP